MSELDSLLPSSANAHEKAIELATARISQVGVPIREIWSADNCPADKLGWLAWAMGVDEWDSGWSEEAKRNTIREALQINRAKGSVWAVRRVLTNAGYGNVQITEGRARTLRNGSVTRNGFISHGGTESWAKYQITLDKPISIAQAAQVRRLLKYAAPARCHLFNLSFEQAANLHDGKITRNGAYSRGVV